MNIKDYDREYKAKDSKLLKDLESVITDIKGWNWHEEQVLSHDRNGNLKWAKIGVCSDSHS